MKNIENKGRVHLIASNQRRRLVVCASGGACDDNCPGDDLNKELKQFKYITIIVYIFEMLLREGFINRDQDSYPYPPGPTRYLCPYCRTEKMFVEILRVILENADFDSGIF